MLYVRQYAYNSHKVMMDSFYLYLDSFSNRNHFPQNKSSSFTNYIYPEIALDYDDEYYVGVKNILFPKKIQCN